MRCNKCGHCEEINFEICAFCGEWGEGNINENVIEISGRKK